MNDIPKLKPVERSADLEAFTRSMDWMRDQVEEMETLAERITKTCRTHIREGGEK